MVKRFFIISLLLLVGVITYGQNSPQFTQYLFNQFYFNPAATGQSGNLQVQSFIRSQYTGYTPDLGNGGQIMSSYFSVDSPVPQLLGGAGVYFSNQNISQAQNVSELALNYSLNRRFNSNIIAYGVGVGFRNLTLRGDDFIQRDPDDPLIPDAKMTAMSPVLNLGAYLINPSYQIGVSVKNVLESSYNIGGTDGLFKENRNYYLTGNYNLPISYTLDIIPMFLIRTDLKTTDIELGGIINYNERYWLGANYRLQDAVAVMAGINLLKDKLKVGYAVDLVTEGVKAKSNTSHELFVKYSLSPIRGGKKTIIKTPRYNIN